MTSAALAGMTAVAFGAFGAHGLKNLVTADKIVLWEKGVQYQIYHSLALFMCYLYLRKESSKTIRNAGWCFLAGIICFSGSLYLLATIQLTGIPVAIIGPITPIGGFFLIAGWGLVLIKALKQS